MADAAPGAAPGEDDRLRGILAFVLAALAVYTLVGLIFYTPLDSIKMTYPVGGEVSNPCGRFGAMLAEKLLFTFGLGAYLAAAIVLGWAALYATNSPLPELWARLLGSSLIVICFATLVSLRGPGVSSSMPGSGGLVGEATALYLLGKFGMVGALLLVGTVAAISLVLATETLLVQGAQNAGLGLSELLDRWGEERRERMVLMRQRQAEERERREAKRAARDAERAARKAEREAEEATRRAEREAERERKRSEREANAREAAQTAREAADLARQTAEAKKRAATPVAPQPAKTRSTQGVSGRMKAAHTGPPPPPEGAPYQLPPLELLEPVPKTRKGHKSLALEEKAELLENAFEQFGITSKVVRISQGPTIAQFECELGPGIKLSKVTALSNDIAMAMQATSVRIVAPLPGKGTFGVEIPNDSRELVRFRELLEADAGKGMPCPLVLGKQIDGDALASDLAKMPHLLIAGTTGSGKSFCVNSIIVSLLYHRKPNELKFILVDPKQVELAPFARIPHLISPPVTDPEKAAGVLNWAVNEMERRYNIFKHVGCRSIETYQGFSEQERTQRWAKAGQGDPENPEDPGEMPYIVIVIDELADLMYTAGKEVEASICRLAQKSRAAGLHLVLATQRPSVDVVTGLIKANLPCRLSFRVNSSHDSKVILDAIGADKLLGKGDMLFRSPDRDGLIRAQGAFLGDEEVSRVVEFCAAQGKPQFHQELVKPKLTTGGPGGNDEDPMFDEAVRIVLEQERGSASLLQRALAIGYTRASRLIDIMETKGILGPHKGSKSREILVTLEEWQEMAGGDDGDG